MSDEATIKEVYKCALCRKYFEKHEIIKINMSSNGRVSNPFDLFCVKCFEEFPPV